VQALRDQVTPMLFKGFTREQIARSLSAQRRAIGEVFKKMTPPEILEKIYARNIDKYGDKLGPTIEYFLAKGKTWSEIIDSACSPGERYLF